MVRGRLTLRLSAWMSLGGGVGSSAMNLLTWFTLVMVMVMVLVVLMITTVTIA